ncbi:hypothetical protein GCM10008983_12830 [Lentibacillus halophilus]|uniref:Putative zinc-finger domain-containing protein n=1 Tax=Lentibacillus halophilus TaxID=295065 RepID=A0ABN0Z7S1_9BACI
MRNKNCDIVRDLLPMHVENLTSDESKQFVDQHLLSCQECKNELQTIQRALPRAEQNKQEAGDADKMVKRIKNSKNQMVLFAVLLGVLFGVYSSMMLFQINEFIAILIFYPVATFVIGLLASLVLKNSWIGPLATLLSSIGSMFLFMNVSFAVWIAVYVVLSLLGSLLGKLILFGNEQRP